MLSEVQNAWKEFQRKLEVFRKLDTNLASIQTTLTEGLSDEEQALLGRLVELAQPMLGEVLNLSSGFYTSLEADENKEPEEQAKSKLALEILAITYDPPRGMPPISKVWLKNKQSSFAGLASWIDSEDTSLTLVRQLRENQNDCDQFRDDELALEEFAQDVADLPDRKYAFRFSMWAWALSLCFEEVRDLALRGASDIIEEREVEARFTHTLDHFLTLLDDLYQE